eukprot:GILK01019952.1.p2 GENE.GILK01019952.1~~GILK01019952.1.p2  ORF type:complete len:125 (+),score=2.14 GILK01019952.1:236-610(+)
MLACVVGVHRAAAPSSGGIIVMAVLVSPNHMRVAITVNVELSVGVVLVIVIMLLVLIVVLGAHLAATLAAGHASRIRRPNDHSRHSSSSCANESKLVAAVHISIAKCKHRNHHSILLVVDEVMA